jgi:TRAP-type C4-dicarboxylate transport system permease small subunit
MRTIQKALNKIAEVKRYICAVLLVIMLGITFVQVAVRYVFNAPFSWAEEVTLMLLVSFGYLCMSLDIMTDSHVSIYFVYNKFPPFVRKLLDLSRHGLLVFFFVNMIVYGFRLTELNMGKQQPASGFSQGWLFLPLVVGGSFMLLYSVFNFIHTLINPPAPAVETEGYSNG